MTPNALWPLLIPRSSTARRTVLFDHDMPRGKVMTALTTSDISQAH